MIQLLFFALAVWLVWKCVKAFSQQFGKNANPVGAASAANQTYRLQAEQNCALALAHPMAFHAIKGGFADSELPEPTDELAASLRPMALHEFGLRTDLDNASVRQQLPDLLRTRWWCFDLDKLQPGDDPRAAMAFACARISFFVRTAAMLGWLPPEQQWLLLQLNAARARDCFASWQDFGEAYVQGRAQWVSTGRADAMGRALSQEELQGWLLNPAHPWSAFAWR